MNRIARLLLVLLFALPASPALAGVRASVDRGTVSVSETFELRLRVDGAASADEPDVSALAQDFEVLSTSRNHRFSLGQGRSESWTEWVLVLMPRREGRLRIPPVTVDGEQSEPLTVVVTPDATPGTAPGGDVALQVEVDAETVHVQQQVLVTVRLLHAVNLGNGAALEELDIPGAVVRKLAEGSHQTVLDGRTFGVFERRYAVFPQRSGDLTIPSMRFAGTTGDSWFDRFSGNGRGVRLRSPERTVRVEPPEDGASPWLPARVLTLVETWDRSPLHLRVGESVTRTITVSANGLTGAQLPPIPDPDVPGLRFYPDQAEVSDEDSTDGVSGTRVQRLAVIPQQPGEYAFPEVRLRWWDTVNGRFAEALVPAKTVRVMPAAGQAATPPASAAPAPAVPDTGTAAQPVAPGGTASPAATGPVAPAQRPWAWIASTVAFGSLALFSTVQWWRIARRAPSSSSVACHAAEPSEPSAFRELEACCRAGDAANAMRCALDWGRARWPEQRIHSLADVARLGADAALARAVDALVASRYAGEPGAWRGDALLAAVSALRGPSRPAGASSALPPLYGEKNTIRR